ncbi:Hint domain-containing protein [Anianabacter salinae]|uniref:Hint domain-containing protein n=1 Tax=Anianabacter salinae TaxID=2851023 RepID=UPI002B1FDCFE|nr:Hint domain-containing protein [Anianabacter salinae]
MDGPTSLLVLTGSEAVDTLHRRAAAAVKRRLGGVADFDEAPRADLPDDPLVGGGFCITDGYRQYRVTLIEMPDAEPLAMFAGDMPDQESDLWISDVSLPEGHINRITDTARSVICFTPGTRLATPDGPRLVSDLAEGDLILTKDDGPQPVRWIGSRRMSGARLFALPELRPIRIRGSALGADVPDAELLVSPDHRMLLRGTMAEALFNSPEVLVRARDMVNDRTITVDHRPQSVTYVHILLDRHQVVWANGLESETFHPASTPFEAIAPDQRAALLERAPDVDRDASLYGGFARRLLSAPEAAILTEAMHWRH